MAAATSTSSSHRSQPEPAWGLGARVRLCTMASSDGGGGSMRGTSTESGASSGTVLRGGRTAPRPRAGTSSLGPGTLERSQCNPAGSSAVATQRTIGATSAPESELDCRAGLAHSPLVEVPNVLAKLGLIYGEQ